MTEPALDPDGEAAPTHPHALWRGDTGSLTDRSRRALLELVRGPYLSQERSPQNWAALLGDQDAIRSRLHDLFLELVVDVDAEFAFVRAVSDTEEGVPRAVRTRPLTFLDTVMLLALRQRLIAEEGAGRVIVGQDEIYDLLQVYRTPDRDESDYTRRLNASWNTMVNKLRVLHPLAGGSAGGSAGGTAGGSAEGATRAEISPVVRVLVDADRVRALRGTYDALASDALASPSQSTDSSATDSPATGVGPLAWNDGDGNDGNDGDDGDDAPGPRDEDEA